MSDILKVKLTGEFGDGRAIIWKLTRELGERRAILKLAGDSSLTDLNEIVTLELTTRCCLRTHSK